MKGDMKAAAGMFGLLALGFFGLLAVETDPAAMNIHAFCAVGFAFLCVGVVVSLRETDNQDTL